MTKKMLAKVLIVLFMMISTTSVYAEDYSEGYYDYVIVEDGVCITRYYGNEKKIDIPSYLGGFDVVELGSHLFDRSSATEITIPETVKRVAPDAFSNSSSLRLIYNCSDAEVMGSEGTSVIRIEPEYADEKLIAKEEPEKVPDEETDKKDYSEVVPSEDPDKTTTEDHEIEEGSDQSEKEEESDKNVGSDSGDTITEIKKDGDRVVINYENGNSIITLVQKDNDGNVTLTDLSTGETVEVEEEIRNEIVQMTEESVLVNDGGYFEEDSSADTVPDKSFVLIGVVTAVTICGVLLFMAGAKKKRK